MWNITHWISVFIFWGCLEKNYILVPIHPAREPPFVRTPDSFPTCYGTRRFITAFTRALHLSVFWARLIQSTPPTPPLKDPYWTVQAPGSFWIYVTHFFYGVGLTPLRIAKLENHPLSFVCGCLFNIFAATLHSWRPILHPQPEDAPWRGDTEPPDMYELFRISNTEKHGDCGTFWGYIQQI
jgi:hypothetical protein